MALPFNDASEPRYKSGDVIAGKYQLEVLLGEGGMGVVWGALNLQLEAPVAIKFLSQGKREERALLTQRLKQEAKAAAKLGHAAIVRVFDVGESELGDPFIVMERLKGRSLAVWLAEDGPIPAPLAVRVLLPIADALAIAHAKGIVHRDLKPDNVFIDESEQLSPKLVDFGIVKVTEPGSEQTHLTQSGMVVGSPDYMSPEQARGRDDVDARTDVWSFCVVLYEVVTGRTPFAAANSSALLVSIALDDPRPFEPSSPEEAELWSIIQRGLVKDRDQRFQSMPELGRALAGWLIRQGIHHDACGASLEAKWILRTPELAAPRAALTSSPVLVITPPGAAPRVPGSPLEVAATHAQPVVNVTPRALPADGVAELPLSRSRRRHVGLALVGGVLVALAGAFALSAPPRQASDSVALPDAHALAATATERAAAPAISPAEVAQMTSGGQPAGPSVEPTAAPDAPIASAAPASSKPGATSLRVRAARPAKAAASSEKASSDLLPAY
jgi:serine/threonine-protein kinase